MRAIVRPRRSRRESSISTSVPGRFERVDCGQPFTVVVDYAHTDDALRNLTALARDFVARAGLKGKVITLFGCGGDRDRAKRPLMGEAAGKGSDFVVLTSDNPRSEDPLAIINDAVVGLQKSGAKYSMEPDRRKAIALALQQAEPGDIVLLAGKGHEKVQITKEGTIPFDDVEVARESLKALGYDCRNAAKAGSAGKSHETSALPHRRIYVRVGASCGQPKRRSTRWLWDIPLIRAPCNRANSFLRSEANGWTGTTLWNRR